jgi:putative spermidine/putrescine transport system substrate-binding protein
MPIVKTSLRKHRLLNVFGALGMLLSPAAVQAAGDDSCSQMQVYLAIAPNHREDVMAYIAPRLQKDLGVTLVAEAIGSAAMVDRVTAQASAPRISIVQWDVPIGITACDQGLCDPIDLSKAPNAQHLTDWAYSRDKAGNTTVLTAGAVGVGFLYNADEFAKHKIEPPKSWKDLADAAYAGRLGVTAPQSTMGTAALVELAKLAGGNESNVDAGFAATKQILARQNTVFTWSSEMSNLFQLGDLWIAVNSSNIAPSLRAKGLPIHFIWPTEGAPAVNSGLSLVKNGPCRQAAYEYIDLYFSAEFQAMRMRNGGGISGNPDAWKLMTPEQMAGLDLQPDSMGKLVNLDWRKINENRPAWIEKWQREIH